ncbi:MAG: glycosyltransferase family 2 protein [Aphanothece sp. CMT-3BRIN-NPC111]|nr:glycosyltransferase family 2 protein [Aphanothece sp. CMT-3BRIN-NPC111]
MESLLAQDYPHVEIIVRDDGSIDNTIELLREYVTTYTNVKVIFGENLGFTRSFLKLLELSDPTADYFAFCDHDDVWQPDKISKAIEFLSQRSPEIPALYCSRLAVVDENLKLLGYSDIPQKELSFPNALVQSSVRGCTIVLNQAARQLFREFPESAMGHDSWIYLVVSAFGTILYDEEPKILYRQHSNNVYGIRLGIVDLWKEKIRRFLNYDNSHRIVKNALEFRRIYGASLSDKHSRTLERFLESRKRFWARVSYALSCEVYRQSTSEHLILKVMLILNRL